MKTEFTIEPSELFEIVKRITLDVVQEVDREGGYAYYHDHQIEQMAGTKLLQYILAGSFPND